MQGPRIPADFRALFESLPGPYLALGPELTIVAASDAYLRANELDRGQIIGRDLSEVFPCATALRSSLARVLAKKVPDAMPAEKHGTAGRYRAWMNTPVLDAAGEVLYILHSANDVTDLEMARIVERRFRTLAEATSEIVWTTDSTGNPVADSPSWRAFTGQSVAEYLGPDRNDMIHDDDLDALRDRWLGAVATRAAFEWECRLLRHDGVYVPMVVRAVPVLNDDGSVREWIGTHTNVTERNDAERRRVFLGEASEALASSLNYETTLACVVDLAVPMLADWCAVHVVEDGSAAPRQVAVAVSDPRVAALTELFGIYAANPEAPNGLPRVLRTGVSEFYEEIDDDLLERNSPNAEHFHRSRALRLTSAMTVPLSARGRVIGAMTFIAVGANRRYSLLDLATAEDLARRAAIAVDNARLFKQAEEAILLRDDFLSVASHELNTPLTPLKLQIGLLLKGNLSPEKLISRLEVADRQIDRMTRLVNQLLDVSRIGARHLVLELEPVDVALLLREVVEDCSDERSKFALHIEPGLA
ncbi:MAG: PAS domain-containing protein, partial [Polyangiaceae bacterium]